MKNRVTTLICLAIAAVISAGCNPRIRVRKSPGPHDEGIRYYRPKPYLLITPSHTTQTVIESKKETIAPSVSDEYVQIELQYLPDFSEEYALDVRPGLGTADVSFTLQDGWMLTEVNQKLDSQFDENVKATAELLKAGASLVPTGAAAFSEGSSGVPQITKKWVVAATNIPLGYYESVISRSASGKTLAGWRYVGFAPFNSCPTMFCGGDAASCSDPQLGPVYGLTFVQGVMTFSRLDVVQSLTANPERIDVAHGQTAGHRSQLLSLDEGQLRQLESRISSEIETSGTGVDIQVAVARSSQAGLEFDYIASVSFQTLLDSAILPIRLKELEQEIRSLFPNAARVRVELLPSTPQPPDPPAARFTNDPLEPTTVPRGQL